jgi:hypothetical protein
LLQAKAIYNGTVPDGEEAHLFQYSVQNVINDCKTATIDFDEKCIVENGDFFQAEAVTCWNLERILDAEQHGQPMPEELIMDDLVREDMMCSK